MLFFEKDARELPKLSNLRACPHLVENSLNLSI